MRILITGAAGFLGSHLTRLLTSSRQHDLVLLDLPGAVLPEDAESVPCDLSDPRQTADLLKGERFDAAVHLAGLLGRHDPEILFRANVQTTESLLRALSGETPLILMAGSCSVYGDPASGEPITEASPTRPVNDYGESMLERERVAGKLAEGFGAQLCTLRLFNLAGPGQEAVMMIPDLARRLVAISRGLIPPRMETGPLYTSRDYVDVRDASRAFELALARAAVLPTVMNIASGIPRSGRSILEAMIDILPIDPLIEEGTGNAGVETICGSIELASARIGWSPLVSFSKTLEDVIEDWNGRI